MTHAALVIIVAEICIYYGVYRSRYGRPAVYRSPHAWILDALAIVSGTSIAVAAHSVLTEPSLLSFPLHPLIGWWFFIIGSSQAVMHLVKWMIRLLHVA